MPTRFNYFDSIRLIKHRITLNQLTITVDLFVCVSVVHRSHGKEPGQVVALGQGDVGQLGLGEDITERKKPALVSLPEKTVQVVAGGMHTVCLSETGHVREHLSYVFCNKNFI